MQRKNYYIIQLARNANLEEQCIVMYTYISVYIPVYSIYHMSMNRSFPTKLTSLFNIRSYVFLNFDIRVTGKKKREQKK